MAAVGIFIEFPGRICYIDVICEVTIFQAEKGKPMTSVENMLAVYNATPADSMLRSIIRRILVNLKDVGGMTIYDLAETCYTSPASISRLVKKLGYKNYSYFQKDVVDCIAKYEHHNRLIPPESIPEGKDLPDAFMDTLESLLANMRRKLDKNKIQELAKAIHDSDKISIYSYNGYSAEIFLQSDIFFSGKICDLYQQERDMAEHTKTLKERDFVLLLAPKCITGTQVDKVIDNIHKRGAKVCVITDSHHFTGLKRAEMSFVFEGVMHSIDMLMLQAFLCMVVMEYRRIYIDEL